MGTGYRKLVPIQPRSRTEFCCARQGMLRHSPGTGVGKDSPKLFGMHRVSATSPSRYCNLLENDYLSQSTFLPDNVWVMRVALHEPGYGLAMETDWRVEQLVT